MRVIDSSSSTERKLDRFFINVVHAVGNVKIDSPLSYGCVACDLVAGSTFRRNAVKLRYRPPLLGESPVKYRPVP